MKIILKLSEAEAKLLQNTMYYVYELDKDKGLPSKRELNLAKKIALQLNTQK